MALLLSLAAVLFCGLMTPRQSGCAHKDTATIPLVLITAVIINNIPLIGKLAHGAPGPLRLCPAGRLRPGPARRRPGPPRCPALGGRCWPRALPRPPAGTGPAAEGLGQPHGGVGARGCLTRSGALGSAASVGLQGQALPEKSRDLLICFCTVIFCLFPASKALVL